MVAYSAAFSYVERMAEGSGNGSADGDIPSTRASVSVGQRIRTIRQEQGISIRDLARKLGVSASLISQIETNKTQPSVSTLYAIVTALDVGVEEVFPAGTTSEAAPGANRPMRQSQEHSEPAPLPLPTPDLWRSRSEAHPVEDSSLVVRLGSGKTLQLHAGVSWERLSVSSLRNIDFLHVTYDVGASSSPNGDLMRHSGIECGFVLAGKLAVTVGFDEEVVTAGDAVSFDSSIPHRLTNVGDEPVHAIWFVSRPH